MKNIMISSILAVSACLAMVGQANAAPNFTKHHVNQVHHQKGNINAHKKNHHIKNKVTASRHKSNKRVDMLRAKNKYQGKNVHAKNSW